MDTGRFIRTALAVLSFLAVLLTLVGGAPASARADDAGSIATTTALSVSGGASYGARTVLTAQVTSGTGVPTGTITFSVEGGGVIAADVPVDAAGVATATFDASVEGLVRYRAVFVGTGEFGPSEGAAFWYSSRAAVKLLPQPTVLRIGGPGGVGVTLTMAAHVRRADDGRPVAGAPVTFKVGGGQPDLLSMNGGTVVCSATTDAQGYATCGGKATVGVVLSLLADGAWAVHPRFGGYEFATAKTPAVGPGAG